MFVIPSIDILNGKTARLFKGDFNQAVYYELSPVDYAKIFAKEGFKRVHIVDLMASKIGVFTALNIIEKIKIETNLIIQVGGGIRKFEDVQTLLSRGADKIVVGSISINNKIEFEKIVREYCDKIIVAADFKGEKIFVKGWTEKSEINLYEHIKYCNYLGIEEFLCTDISRDGAFSGYGIETYEKIIGKFPMIKLIASGGASSLEDLLKAEKAGAYAAIVGKAIYEQKIKLEELKKYF